MNLPTPYSSWAELIALVASGDKRARERLADTICEVGFPFFRRRLPKEDAEDLSQDLAFRVFERLHQCRGSQFRAWVYAIARQILGERARRRASELPPPPALQAELAQHEAGNNGTLTATEEAALEQALLHLTPMEEELVLSQTGLQPETLAAIGKKRGISATLARVKYLRAKRKLKQLLRANPGMKTWFARHPLT